MRRSRIQVKPNIAKGAKQTVVKNEQVTPQPVVVAAPDVPEATEAPKAQNAPEDPPPAQIPPETLLDPPSESLRTLELDRPPLHVDVKPTHHVHFTDDVIDNEQNHNQTPMSIQTSPSSIQHSPQFATPHPPSRLMTPRSRNVSMCEDESILQPKQPRDKRRFSGKEELDTKTWKMSDLARWNPRNEHTSFKRERRSSTSSTIITKSEIGDPSLDPPRVNAPQVKIGADGRLVIDETSLVVQSAQINHESVWETVEEGRMGSKITSLSFRSRIFRKPTPWNEKETDLFYEVLQCTGTDFGLMHHYLPQRSRPELKAKYNKEEKCNWERLLRTISHPVRLDGSLEDRIAKIQVDMEEEIKEKKARNDHEKAEEKRARLEKREQAATEREEERMKKAEASKLVRQAKELERGARIAAKCNEKAEKEAKIRQRVDAKQMAMEAKRIATEARAIIREARAQEAAKRDYARRMRQEENQDSLEREAERIIRRLIQENRREEKEKKSREKQKKKERDEAVDGVIAAVVAGVAGSVGEAGVDDAAASTASALAVKDNDKDSDEDDSSSSDSSTSATSSDEDALKVKIAQREKDRMKAERRNLEPRKSVAGKKPVYVDNGEAKYAQEPVEKIIEAAKTNGYMFNSADEEDGEAEWNQMDTSQPGPAPPPMTRAAAARVKSVSPEPVAKAFEASEAPASNPAPIPNPEAKDPEPLIVDVEDAIPQSVTDVVEDMARARSKTPTSSPKETEKKNEKKEKRKKNERKGSAEPPAKVPKIVVMKQKESKEEEKSKETDKPKEPNYELITDMEVAETIDVETSFEEPNPAEIVDIETVDDGSRHDVPGPSTSSAPPPASAPRARRTVKKPVSWKKKK